MSEALKCWCDWWQGSRISHKVFKITWLLIAGLNIHLESEASKYMHAISACWEKRPEEQCCWMFCQIEI